MRVCSCEFMWPQRQEVWSNSNSELPDVATGKQEKNVSLNTQPSIQPSTTIFSFCLYLWFSLVVWQWNCKTLLLHMKMLFNYLNMDSHDTDVHIWIQGSKHFQFRNESYALHWHSECVNLSCCTLILIYALLVLVFILTVLNLLLFYFVHLI